MTLVRRKEPGQAWETEADTGGGSGPVADSATFTTDADAFEGSHVFDLGGPAVVSATLTLTAEVADGETFGEGDGEISGTVFVVSSSDGEVQDEIEPNTGPMQALAPQLVNVNQATQIITRVTSRYLIVRLDIDEAPDFNLYAGPNHPTMTVRIDIIYR